MGFRYPQPDNEDAFEQMCLRFYRKLWKNESLQLYAKRGEEQDGVDIHDPACLRPVRAVQCKHREATRTLQPCEIREEVGKAEGSTLRIDRYVIATTAKKSKKAQDTVVELNSRPDGEKKFTVDLHFWEDICEQLSRLTQVQAQFIVAGRDVGCDVLASILQDPQIALAACRLLGVAAVEISAGALSEIEQLLADRSIDVARHELDKFLGSKDVATLSIDQQYQVLRLQGKFAMEAGQFEIASQQFLAAFELQPHLDQAKQNRVLAYALMPDAQKAFELASQYVAEGLATAAMLCRLIESASVEEQINEQMSLIIPYISTDEDINIALCHKLLQLGNNTAAATAAMRAVDIAPDSPHAHFAVALSAHDAAVKGDWRQRKSRLESALTHYGRALEGARQDRYGTLLPEILVNRATVHMLTGNIAAAATDYRAAVCAVNKPSAYAACAVSFFLRQQEPASAWELLEFLDQSTLDGEFLKAVTEINCTDDDKERRGHLERMKQLAEESWPRAVECRLHCVNWALRLRDPEFARSCITDVFQGTFPFLAFTALAWIASESGDRATAAEYARIALSQSALSTRVEDLRLLADVLIRLDQHVDALDLLERAATPGVLDDDTRLLVNCAQRLERHDLLLRMCRELRETGEQDDQLRRMELQLLSRYAPEQGLSLADEFIRTSPTPAYFVAFKNLLAIRLDRREVLQLEASQLPPPAGLSPRESPLVILPYVAARKFGDGLRFLYAQLRTYFDDEHAHGQFVFYVLTYGDQTSLQHPPTKVESQCAVLLDVERNTRRWVIIENDNPAPSRGEFAESSELVQRLIGRNVGDVIDLPGSLVQTEKATIREIQTKYLRAFQDSLQRFRERFPDTSFVQQIHVGNGDDFDPTPIIESVKQRRAYIERSIEFYRTNPCPLYLLAARTGVSELDAIKALTRHPTTTVKCCQTTPHQFAQAVAEGLTGEVVVLDISAIVTLTLLDGWSYLDSGRKYFVSQTTKERVDRWLNVANDEHAHEGGCASVAEDGRLLIHETTRDERDARSAQLESMKAMIETHCDCRSSEALAAISPERRDAYEQVAGFHNVESMGVAKDLDAVLWSDDVVLSAIAKSDFNVKCVWTQLGLRCLVNTGHLTIETYNLVSAKLASWGYTQILWNPETIIRAAEYAKWDPQEWPLEQCIKLIPKSSLSLPAKARVALECLKLLRRSRCSAFLQSAVIQAILSGVGDRRAVTWMHGRLDNEFLIDFESAEFLRPELKYWLASHPR